MSKLLDAAFWGVLIACAVIATGAVYLAIRHRRKWLPELEELVTLDSRGWRLVAIVSTAGAIVMIATSQLFSSNYWIGLALDAEGLSWPKSITGMGPMLLSVSVWAAFALSVMFELVSDIGAPAASGLKKEKRKGIPEMLLIVTAFSIVMSLASKWGYYEDRRQVRAMEAARAAVIDSDAAQALKDAEAEIERLRSTPPAETLAARADTALRRIGDLSRQRAEAIRARDALPESHSTNRLRYQDTIDRYTAQIDTIEQEKAAIEAQRRDLQALDEARAARDRAAETLANDAGKLTEDRKERVKIGDTVLIRAIRSVLHQALCFLFPIIALEAWSAHREKLKREDAAARAADTRRRNNPNTVYDGDFSEAPQEESAPKFGGYLEAGAEGEAGGSAEAAAFSEEEDLGGELPDDFEGEPPEENDGERDGT